MAENALKSGILNRREGDILCMRLGAFGSPPSTLREIAAKYNISRERVRQIGVSITQKIIRRMPAEKRTAAKLFAKAWEPKYAARKKRLKKRRAVIKRKRTIMRNKCSLLEKHIDKFVSTGDGKDNIVKLFRYLRAKRRKNRSLFGEETNMKMKFLAQRYKEAKRSVH